VIPPISIPARHIETINEYTKKIAVEFGVVGLMNIQYAIAGDVVYILEANPRASRTVPLVSKVCNISMARIATQIMLGKKLKDLNLKHKSFRHFGVKEAVFPFNMYQEVDPILGPEMRSTGEVLGLADSFGLAYYKAQEATGQSLPAEGTVLITVEEKDKGGILEVARAFINIGFKIIASDGTYKFFNDHGISSDRSSIRPPAGFPNTMIPIFAKRPSNTRFRISRRSRPRWPQSKALPPAARVMAGPNRCKVTMRRLNSSSGSRVQMTNIKSDRGAVNVQFPVVFFQVCLIPTL
jgi:carbamoyl-phosphate synthase large subunit